MDQPLVSVVLPTYNGLSRGFLTKAITSVLSQTYNHFELIIVDDGSFDNIKQGCESALKDDRVYLIRQENQGLAAARKKGIEHARGVYIALIDDDDLWVPDKIAKQVDFMQRHPDAKIGMVFCGVRLIDAKGHVLGVRVKEAKGGMYRSLIENGNGITAPSAVLFKRQVIGQVGNFDPAMRSLEDLDLWIRIARQFHIYSMSSLLVDYRVHENTITAKSFRREEEYEQKLYDHIIAHGSTWDRDFIYSRMWARFGVRHFSLGNYQHARKFFAQSCRLRFAVKCYGLFGLTFLPGWVLNGLKYLRRQLIMIVIRRQ